MCVALLNIEFGLSGRRWKMGVGDEDGDGDGDE